jgi:Ricin-type beta-trefoil lectin domain/Regulator of chromosome condensation (RCC1) repeat/Fibronectin type III domain
VLAGKNLTQITAGLDYTCALDSAGAVYCWGLNGGDLGNGSTGNYSVVPVLAGPQPPARVTAVSGSTTAKVSWTAPASLDGGALTGYTATASPGGAACSTTGSRTCTITGLAGLGTGSVYSITVVAHTTVGDSGASAPAIFTSVPTGPIVSGNLATKCVDDSNDSSANDTKIVIWDCNGSSEQTWAIEPDGTIQVQGKCVDIYRDEKTSKAPVELWTCTGGSNQQWKTLDGTLINPASHKCLDDPRFNTTNGTQLEIYTCNGGVNQEWELP